MVASRGAGAPGEVYPLVPALIEPLRKAFAEGVATHTDIYENQSGTWTTAFAPIRDSGGRVFAVLDVDYPVEVYVAELAQVRRRFYLHALAGAVLALVAGALIARRITRPVTRLAALARSVVEGVVPLLMPALDVVGGHHERWDGKGYPQGLSGEEIPFTARVFSVVDALDAMTHDRPYRKARPLEQALATLRQEAGSQFDPRVVDAALSVPADQWEEIR